MRLDVYSLNWSPVVEEGMKLTFSARTVVHPECCQKAIPFLEHVGDCPPVSIGPNLQVSSKGFDGGWDTECVLCGEHVEEGYELIFRTTA